MGLGIWTYGLRYLKIWKFVLGSKYYRNKISHIVISISIISEFTYKGQRTGLMQ